MSWQSPAQVVKGAGFGLIVDIIVGIAFLFADALGRADGPFLLTAALPVAPARCSIPLVSAMVNEPSVDALSITLTVSAFVERDMLTARLKMMMNDLETNATAGGVDDGQEASPEIKAFFARMMRTRII